MGYCNTIKRYRITVVIMIVLLSLEIGFFSGMKFFEKKYKKNTTTYQEMKPKQKSVPNSDSRKQKYIAA